MVAYHAIERTSLKGPGQNFIGTCIRCGKTGLTVSGVFEECKNTSGMSNDEALIRCVEGPQ